MCYVKGQQISNDCHYWTCVTKSQVFFRVIVFLLLLVTVVVVVVVVFRIWCSIIMVHAIKLLNSDLLRAVQLIQNSTP